MRPILTYDKWTLLNESKSREALTKERAIDVIKELATVDGSGRADIAFVDSWYNVPDDVIKIHGDNGWGGNKFQAQLTFNEHSIDDDIFSAWEEVSDLLPNNPYMTHLKKVEVWEEKDSEFNPINFQTGHQFENLYFKFEGNVYHHFRELYNEYSSDNKIQRIKDLIEKLQRSTLKFELKEEFIPNNVKDFKDLFKMNIIIPEIVFDLDEMKLTDEENSIWKLTKITTS